MYKKDKFRMKIQLDYVWGFSWAIIKSRLSHNSQGDSSLAGSMKTDWMGPDDEKLARKLVKRGHLKFLESVVIWYTVTATRGFWHQESTYRVGITRLSESTSYTILNRHLTQDDFAAPIAQQILTRLNQLIDVRDQEQLELELPEGFLQTRGVRASYRVLRHMYHQRRNHRRSEWQTFCDWCEGLPYAWLVTE